MPNVRISWRLTREKSWKKYITKYIDLGLDEEKAKEVAWNDVQREMEQRIPGMEYKFNSVSSSRGDYPFITMTAGTGTSRFAKMATITMLNVRKKVRKRRPQEAGTVPEACILYDENLHGPGKELEDVFEAGIECSSKTMYPDWLSLSGEDISPACIKKYGKDHKPHGDAAPFFPRGMREAAWNRRTRMTFRCLLAASISAL